MSDLTTQEQGHVRAALRFLRARCGGWEPMAKALRFSKLSMRNIMKGKPVSASLAVRVARFAAVPVDDVLGGKYPPPGSCPHCGHIQPSQPNGPTIEAAR